MPSTHHGLAHEHIMTLGGPLLIIDAFFPKWLHSPQYFLGNHPVLQMRDLKILSPAPAPTDSFAPVIVFIRHQCKNNPNGTNLCFAVLCQKHQWKQVRGLLLMIQKASIPSSLLAQLTPTLGTFATRFQGTSSKKPSIRDQNHQKFFIKDSWRKPRLVVLFVAGFPCIHHVILLLST